MSEFADHDGAAPAVRPLAGVRVIEVASWLMAPTAGGILADWGADVIKVEHPVVGDPMRGLAQRRPGSSGRPVNLILDHANRGKRSIGVDIGSTEGAGVLRRLVRSADVFLTNYLPAVRQRLRVDVGDIASVNPGIVYARASAVGPRGPEHDKGGYDFATFWCRSGMADAYHQADRSYPPTQNGGFGDGATAAVLAGGISAALLHRERTGNGVVVDGSLLATGLWIMGLDIANSIVDPDYRPAAQSPRTQPGNPLVNIFRTADDRYFALVLLQADRQWPELCSRLGHLELVDDPRFATSGARFEHREECTQVLDAIIGEMSLAYWQDALAGSSLVWDPVQRVGDVADDPQVIGNDYLVEVDGVATPAGTDPLRLVASPIQFNAASPTPRRAPEHGEHTEEVLMDIGYDWDEIVHLKDAGVVV